MQLSVRELAGAVDRNEQIQLAFLRPHLSHVDREVPDRIRFEFLFGWLIAFNIRQAADAMALIAAVQR